LSSENEKNTTVYLTLPLVSERLPLNAPQLKTSTISTHN
jgi:hypothetical protein